MRLKVLALCLVPLAIVGCASNSKHDDEHAAHADHGPVSDVVIATQQLNLAKNTEGKGFGPQSPRDIDAMAGSNPNAFSAAPPYNRMNLCNIHFHQNAEHKGGEFTRYVGNGDGKGHNTGFAYNGTLSEAERRPAANKICPSSHGELKSGDTIEVHYVHSTAPVRPGPTLGACLSPVNSNPQLRVETVVAVLVNDKTAADFVSLARDELRDGRAQAPNLPNNLGTPVQYAGSTTGPSYNEAGSPLQVTWSVRPRVLKVDIESVGRWCQGNVYKEDHAHGSRNLVKNPALLSAISR